MSRSLLLLVLAGVASVGTAWTCSPTKIIDWRASCDKLGSDDEKCKNGPCHRALHYLVEDIVRDCYVQSGMGDASDLDVYRILDDYCHGETPAPKPVPTTSTPTPTTSTPVPPLSPFAAYPHNLRPDPYNQSPYPYNQSPYPYNQSSYPYNLSSNPNNQSPYPHNLRPHPHNQSSDPYFSTSCTTYNQPCLRTPDTVDKRTSCRIADRPHNLFPRLFSPHVLGTVHCRSFQCDACVDIRRFNALA
ncbi:hypothetical protein DYB30_004911 [Aphanomyces astaci]|uniref:Uncharacterized protein n=1 Tax=Aphanomyces astaci TaxID=112090 RepID=A0A397DAX2_APHAT|nr:hypothetical protein DYB30_004911 [Aphanomyces astaci]